MRVTLEQCQVASPSMSFEEPAGESRPDVTFSLVCERAAPVRTKSGALKQLFEWLSLALFPCQDQRPLQGPARS